MNYEQELQDYELFFFFGSMAFKLEYKKVICDTNFESHLALEISKRYWKEFKFCITIRQS